jgi:hypothetical protein
VELDAVLEGQPRLCMKTLEQLSFEAYSRVFGVHFLDDLVPLRLSLDNYKATEQLISLQGLRPCKFADGLLIFLDR